MTNKEALQSILSLIDTTYPESEWILNKFQQFTGKLNYHFDFRNKLGTERFKSFDAKSLSGLLEKIKKLIK